MNNQIRIIGGRYRGKKISFPDAKGLRPTPDRVRETLFNWLMHDICGARCLDAFAGSGALGLEALSRGAEQVIMIESHGKTYRYLKAIKENMALNELTLLQTDACAYVKQTSLVFDIIFLDPPFAHPEYFQVIDVIRERNLLQPEGFLYVESPQENLLNLEYWHCEHKKQAGEVHYALYRRVS